MSSARNFYAYHSDHSGVVYQVALSDDNAVAGGFGSPVVEGANPGYPIGWRMRHVSAVSGSGKRTTCPIANNGDTAYTSGGTISKPGGPFTIQGRIGERMTSKK